MKSFIYTPIGAQHRILKDGLPKGTKKTIENTVDPYWNNPDVNPKYKQQGGLKCQI